MKTSVELFIEQLENIIFLAFKAAKITLQLPSVAKNSIIQSDDIDYILKNYHLSDIFENVMELFKKDIYTFDFLEVGSCIFSQIDYFR